MSNEYFPHLEFILYDALNSQPILKKLRELQANLAADKAVTNDLLKDSSNIELIENLLATYTNSQAGDDLNDQIDLLFEMISQWPIGGLKIA